MIIYLELCYISAVVVIIIIILLHVLLLLLLLVGPDAVIMSGIYGNREDEKSLILVALCIRTTQVSENTSCVYKDQFISVPSN